MSGQEHGAGRVAGSVETVGNGRGKVRMDSLYDTDPDDLWSALTEPSRLARWVAQVDGDLHVGGSFSARFTSGWDGPGEVEVCDPPHRLVVRMAPGTGDETVIEAVLSPEGTGARLIVAESGIALTEIGAHGAGWQVHMQDLWSYLGRSDGSDWQTRWLVLAPAYEEMARNLQ